MTASAITKCSKITFQGLFFCSLAMFKLRMDNTNNPQITLTKIAVDSSNNKIGMINVNAKRNLEKNVEIVDSQISLEACRFSDSSEIWMPNASENASAIAIINMPPIITSFE